MHIADGIIDTGLCIAAHAVSAAWIYMASRKIPAEDIPKLGMTSAALFVASLIHFPFAGTSLHLGLYGIAGIILGKRVFPAIFTALLFQSLIMQHGGLLTLGVNALNMGIGATSAWLIWQMVRIPGYLRAMLAGFLGILVPVVLMALEFSFSGYGKGMVYLLSAYVILAVIEAIITMSAVKLLKNRIRND